MHTTGLNTRHERKNEGREKDRDVEQERGMCIRNQIKMIAAFDSIISTFWQHANMTYPPAQDTPYTNTHIYRYTFLSMVTEVRELKTENTWVSVWCVLAHTHTPCLVAMIGPNTSHIYMVIRDKQIQTTAALVNLLIL